MIYFSRNEKCERGKFIKLAYDGIIQTQYLEVKSTLKHFPCGEFEFLLEEDIAGQEITIFQSFVYGKFNDDLIKLQIVCDVLRCNNVKKIIYFAPFLPYTRQDKACNGRISLGLKIVAEIINNCSISEVITYDLHALQVKEFFKCNVQNLTMIPKFIEHINNNFNSKDLVIVFPDAGSASRFSKFFIEEAFETIIINKNRIKGEIQMKIQGNVKNKTAIIIDDIIDSGETIIKACKILSNQGTNEVFCYATHGIFSGNAIEKLVKSKIKKIIISNSVCSSAVRMIGKKIEVIDI